MSIFFSIIIPTFNEEIHLPLLLNSLSNQTEKDFEVIVCDNNSTDQTKNKAEEFKSKLPFFKFLSQNTRNVSEARNLGAKNALGECLIFFDSDVEVDINFIKEIKNKIINNNLDLTTVWNRPNKESTFKGKSVLMLLNLGMSIISHFTPIANGPCIIIKKDLFEKTGGFNPKIVFAEDLQLIKEATKFKPKSKVFRKPHLYMSTRRFEKEGFFFSLYKALYALLYQVLKGPILKPIFEYKMGGEYFKK